MAEMLLRLITQIFYFEFEERQIEICSGLGIFFSILVTSTITSVCSMGPRLVNLCTYCAFFTMDLDV